jgi:hypothetical protein
MGKHLLVGAIRGDHRRHQRSPSVSAMVRPLNAAVVTGLSTDLRERGLDGSAGLLLSSMAARPSMPPSGGSSARAPRCSAADGTRRGM